MAKIGIIGRSGLDDPNILKSSFEKEVDTPYGRSSSCLTCGKIGEVVEIYFVIELPELGGREKLIRWTVYSLVSFEGE